MSKVEIVIPTKSYMVGLTGILEKVCIDPLVERVTVVADGDKAYNNVLAYRDVSALVFEIEKVPLGQGIHNMWNIGLNKLSTGNHFLMINDDVTVHDGMVSGLLKTIEENPELGIVCPNYDKRVIEGPYFPVSMTCGGNYSGGGGLGGFCMMLASDLASKWRFDETMKWWYGDDDVLWWVRKTENRVAAICRDATCSDNESWTLTYDPPANFHADIENDRIIFEKKWAS